MPNTSFAFKQFTIQQNLCAMKVGTDAVLLGSWIMPQKVNRILDIGTGTGIIALMLAQKTEADIVAIDIDEHAVKQATQNVLDSKFKNNIDIQLTSVQQYALTHKNLFDLIVTNPPYFEQSLKSVDEQRSQARHADVLPFGELIESVINLLTDTGKFYVILPRLEAEKFTLLAEKKGLKLTKLLRVKSRADKPVAKRHLMQFEFKATEFSESTLIIEHEMRHQYTEEYKNLTKDYYVNF